MRDDDSTTVGPSLKVDGQFCTGHPRLKVDGSPRQL